MSKEAMKLALEALSPWAGEDANHTEQYAAYQALREALAEQPAQQEPWGACVYGRVFVGRLPEHARKFSEDEGVPIQWLYTSPQSQRKPLTDEQIRAVIAKIDPNEHYLPNSLRQLARAIEAAHGIKGDA